MQCLISLYVSSPSCQVFEADMKQQSSLLLIGMQLGLEKCIALSLAALVSPEGFVHA